MTPDAVLFDCDGVLVDSEPATRRLLVARLREAGLEIDGAEFDRQFLGGTMAGTAEKARAMGADLGDDWVAETYEELYVALAGTQEIPGAAALLDALAAADVPFAVCSNGPVRKMEVTLDAAGLAERLSGRILSAHDHPPPKPAPDLYLAGAALCGVAPARAVVVEDSPTGARAAAAAGVPCLGLAAGEEARLMAGSGARIVASLAEVQAIVLG
jgi:HAD superfamily hydrolase (TIGR01509 family)